MNARSCTLEKVLIGLLLLSALPLLSPALCAATEVEQTPEVAGRERLLAVSREIMKSAGYCSLLTLDGSGRPQARIMDPFAPDEGMVVWLGTTRMSRKVEQIRNDPRVTLFYFDSDSMSYVTLLGIASLVDDPEEKSRHWKEGWEAFYPGDKENYLLIQVVPNRLEVLSIAHEIGGDPVTWTPQSLEFEGSESIE
jgi:general stress protein 26